MFDLKKGILTGLVAALLALAPSAWAASFVNGNLSMEITISDMDSVDLSGFDMEIAYDSSLLDFSGYVLTDELGSIDDGQAVDNSYSEENSFTSGTITLSVVSLLEASELADQLDDFVLVTLYFWGDEEALSTVNVSSLDISIANVSLNAISFSIDVETQANATVPVPSAFSLLALGLMSLSQAGRRRKA